MKISKELNGSLKFYYVCTTENTPTEFFFRFFFEKFFLRVTRYVLMVCIDEMSRGWVTDKLHIFQQLLKSLLEMEDSLQSTRIIISLSPFSSLPHTKGIYLIFNYYLFIIYLI